MKNTLVDLKDITFRYKKNLILNKINLEIKEGDKIALLGKSGAGKSTLISILNGTIKPTEGSIRYPIKEYKELKKNKQINIGTIWQDLRLIDELTAEQNVNCGLLGQKSALFAIANLLNICSFKKAHICMGICGLDNNIFLKNMNQISGGQKQRVAIARSLIQEPTVLFADAPFNNLDPKMAIKIKNIFLSNTISNRISIPKTLLFSLHRIELLEGFNRIIGLYNGRIIFNKEKENFKAYHLDKIY